MTIKTVVAALGKGPGFLGLAFIEMLIGAILLVRGVDGMSIAAVFGAINVPVYGGGAWKAMSEAPYLQSSSSLDHES